MARKLKTYTVTVSVSGSETWEVKAIDPEAAKEKVRGGQGERTQSDMEYSDNEEEWEIEEEEE